ncbi:hypothetical protein EZ428_08785 [Pedobacter frigiditerrae]|uniref:GLPGLI family protein n=1 Tax=Pedobacter frigiditerrae TaxID=2530452 RepID=A0A4R0N0L7_9SPHI|nr:hypothetical protein [Pedobacter frigiditerrae]TCC91834.1 hypothetical protein EZ428_08785 [Pedobacter frigiditerrae]
MQRIIINSLFLSLIFSSFFVFAQKDYIVNNAGDTTKGQFKKQLISTGLKFRANGKSQFEDVNYDDLSAYYKSKDSSSYVLKTIPTRKKPLFLERLENGKVKLYEHFIAGTSGYMGAGTASQTIWYASKDNGDLLEIKTNNILGTREERKSNFYDLIGDYKELWNDFIAEKNFSYEMIESYIKKYNYYHKYLLKK